MTPQLPRIYTYKITFEEVPYYYYGWHKEKRFNEEYLGSPITHKWCWEFYTPKKQILEVFEYSDEGCLKAQEVESRLIKPVMNTDSRCLNANCGGFMSIDARVKGGKIGYELSLGVHALTKDQMRENGKMGGKIGGKIVGEKMYELGRGIHAQTPEQKSEFGKMGGKMGGKIIGEKLAKEFTLVSPTGEVISGRNIREFCVKYNLQQSCMTRLINGERNYHKGYRRLEVVPVLKVAQ
jgi:hypothetical protein